MNPSVAKEINDAVVLPATHTYKTLDAWRGLASLWVVLFHASAPLLDKEHLQNNPLYTLPLLGYLGVWMFFVISGYCISHAAAQSLSRPNGLRTYVVARFRRIYLPCWFSLIFYIALSALAFFLVSHNFLKSSTLAEKPTLHHGWLFYVSNLSLTQVLLHQNYISDVCWTLCYEVGFYVLVGIAIAFASKIGNERTLLSGLHILTICSLLFFIIAPGKICYPFDYWPQFGLGILIYDLIKHHQKITMIAAGMTAILFVVFAWTHSSGVGYHGIGGRIPFLFGLAFAATLMLIHRYDEQLSRIRFVQWLSRLGLFSYSLYLIHVLVVGVVLQVLNKLHLEAAWIGVDLSVIVSVIAAYGFYLCFEKPFIKKNQKARVLVGAEPIQ